MTCPHAFPSLAIPLIGMRVRAQVQAHMILMPIPLRPTSSSPRDRACSSRRRRGDRHLHPCCCHRRRRHHHHRRRRRPRPSRSSARARRRGVRRRCPCRPSCARRPPSAAPPWRPAGQAGRHGGRGQADRRRPLLPRVQGQPLLIACAPGMLARARRALKYVCCRVLFSVRSFDVQKRVRT